MKVKKRWRGLVTIFLFGYILPYSLYDASPVTGLAVPWCLALTLLSHASFFEAVWKVVSPSKLILVGVSPLPFPLEVERMMSPSLVLSIPRDSYSAVPSGLTRTVTDSM